LQQQIVRTDLHALTEFHLFLHVAIEGIAQDSDENQHHAHVYDVAAIATRVAHSQFNAGSEERYARTRANDSRATIKLHQNCDSHEDAQDEAKHRIEKSNAKSNPITPESSAAPTGQAKFRFRLSVEVLRQASSGPTPVRNKSIKPRGTFTLLKKGAPTLMRSPVIHSEKTGNKVPKAPPHKKPPELNC